jgi:DNA repair protein RecO (recombination protein O)
VALYAATGLVLRRIPLGEKDKIITLYTRERGKVRAVAKGARKTTSKLAGGSEPLMLVRALLSEGQSLDVLSQAEVRESFPLIRGEWERFLRATYACELLDRLTEEADPEEGVFELLLNTFYTLQRATQPDLALHAFELHLMARVGYEPQLFGCVQCERSWEPPGFVPVAYSPVRGGALCEGCADASREEPLACTSATVALLLTLATLTEPKALAALTTDPQTLKQSNRVLRAHLKLRLERAIKSTEFLDALRLEE